MYCRDCNSRIRRGSKTCQNCGSHSIVRQVAEQAAVTRLPPPVINVDPTDPMHPGYPEDGAGAAAAGDDGGNMDRVREDGPEEVELHEPANLGSVDSDPDEEAKETPPESGLGTGVERGAFVAPLDAEGLRSLLVENPDMLETGLRIFANDKGIPLGAGYTTAVGEIHLLARDANDGFVVVMVAEDESAEQLVAGVLQRIGWVSKHLGAGDGGVRGIVLLSGERDDIAYAAAAVSDMVSFKTHRIAVCFDDLRY
jgi:hypothetical protein